MESKNDRPAVHNRTTYLEFFSQMISDQGGQWRKQRSQKNTNISDVNCNMKEIQEVIQDGRCYHEPCEN